MLRNWDEIYYMILFLRSKGPKMPPNCNETQQYCFTKLAQVSRSFSSVILSLSEELCEPVCLFYLVCRGIDTIEDDMKPSVDTKTPPLREFHKHLNEKGWKLKGFGDKQTEIDLLEQFDKVIDRLSTIKPKYFEIIQDIAREMGNGMADFLEKKVVTIEDYNLYCWYVAGLVGEGLSRMFAATGTETADFAKVKDLYTSMGLFLQKTNITRDYLEDVNEVPPRLWWPKEIWEKYTDDVLNFKKPENMKPALACLNHMVTDAMTHSIDCLKYLKMIKDPASFRFCAIPQVMAIATLYECYNNPNVFKKEVKIRKSLAVKMIMTTNDYQSAVQYFRYFGGELKKAIPKSDPNAKRLSSILLDLEKHISQPKN
uniref:Squalene synthase n=1 Tax=Arcella intermedia TaxID=1963864 RepID=A0A6B2L775_9EUKA